MDEGNSAAGASGAGKEALSEIPVETLLKSLEEILQKLESGDTPLEESFRLYEGGMRLVKEINAKIDRIEKKMITLDGEDHE